jgi:hypothetical protein
MFFGLHLYPTPYTLVPAYLTFGLWLGPLVSARLTFLMTLASKLSYVVTEEEEEESSSCRKTVLRRLARGLQTAQDFGLVLGNGVTAFLLWYTEQGRCFRCCMLENLLTWYTQQDGCILTVTDDAEFPQPELDALFLTDGSQEHVCGSEACPSSSMIAEPVREANSTVSEAQLVFVLPCRTSAMLASVFLGCSVMGLAVTTAFLDRIRMFVYQERPTGIAAVRAVHSAFRDPRLQLAAPLAVFIGLEQGFMLTDFSKVSVVERDDATAVGSVTSCCHVILVLQSYVVCTLGLPNVSLVFLSLGALQSLAAFTLSMMLRHIQRCIVIGKLHGMAGG